MRFTHHDLRTLKAGQVVSVTLSGNAANVKLMDSYNFNNYKNRKQHHYYGGHITSSRTRLEVPSTGQWHLTIDLGGYQGNVRSNVQVY
ncbi:DUF1883 domain-containing protein [Yersinia ruckeri]|uniref:DUF1883 domain-containing protein n=1 Tax=Yersinia ruckeri TaxID=29486 RepID=UPI0008FF381F|nr:DUF1883 domain-containing protein [Yersinia ruckeri]PHZ18145.1 DUF1883 domain-containing protein [Yersinia ruckeri]